MRLLAMDTATSQVGAALIDGTGVIGEVRLAGGRRHGEMLAPLLERLLADCGVPASDLAALAVDAGPGLFTGLRVGIATATALGSALDLPVYGVGSLEALLFEHRHAARPVVAMIDAKRGEVFVQGGPGTDHFAEGAAVREPSAVCREVSRIPDVLAVGDGAARYRAQLAPFGVEISTPLSPGPAAIAELAWARHAAGRLPTPEETAPVYLREADVRIGWATHQPGTDALAGR